MTHLFTMFYPVCFNYIQNHRNETGNHILSAIITLSVSSGSQTKCFILIQQHSPEETEEPDRLELLDAAISSNSLNVPAYWRLLGLDSSPISVSALLTCPQLSRVPPKQPIISSCESRIRRESPTLPHLQARVWQQKNHMVKLVDTTSNIRTENMTTHLLVIVTKCRIQKNFQAVPCAVSASRFRHIQRERFYCIASMCHFQACNKHTVCATVNPPS